MNRLLKILIGYSAFNGKYIIPLIVKDPKTIKIKFYF